MAKQFAELEAKMSPDAKARSNALYHTLLAEMPLNIYIIAVGAGSAKIFAVF